jgi:hypothetical protein
MTLSFGPVVLSFPPTNLQAYLTCNFALAFPRVPKRMERCSLRARARVCVCVCVCVYVTLMRREIAGAATCETYVQSHYMFKETLFCRATSRLVRDRCEGCYKQPVSSVGRSFIRV